MHFPLKLSKRVVIRAAKQTKVNLVAIAAKKQLSVADLLRDKLYERLRTLN